MVGFSPAHLCAVAVGDPHGGTDVAEEVRDHVLAAAVANDEAAVFAVMKDPGPPVLFADPDAGLVRLQHGACEQAGADQVVLPGERRPAVGEHVDQRAFADRKPEQIRHQPRQPLERDGVHEAQIDHESPQVRPERRARRHVGRRVRPQSLAAARAQPAMQRHPRDVRLDLRNLDVVVGVERRLRDARHVGPAMATLIDQNIAPARRIRMQRTMRPRMRNAGAFTPAHSRIGRRLLPLRRRRARIVRRLRRQTELRFKLRHPRRKRQNQFDQGFLVQRLKGLAIHPIRESDPTALVKAADPNCLEPVTSEIRLEIGLSNYP